MKQQLQQRLQELKAEFESGQKVLVELEAKQANVQNTMLRIQQRTEHKTSGALWQSLAHPTQSQ